MTVAGWCRVVVWCGSAVLSTTLALGQTSAPEHGAVGGANGSAERPIAESGAAPLPAAVAPGSAPSALKLGGYVEAYYQWNTRRPRNGITNLRGFDNRHDSLTLSNAVVDAQWDDSRVIGRFALQIGATPSSYYAAEPALPGSNGANGTDAALWKYVQQAHVGYRFPLGRGLTVLAGVFLSPIGPESMAVHENWTWSRSNLFYGLPFYHTGARASLPLSERWTATLAVYNGWNSVVDSNRFKSVSAQLTYSHDDLSASLLYFGGVERPTDAPEGPAYRHLVDAHATIPVMERLTVLLHANGGSESNRFGTSRWWAGAAAARVTLHSHWALAARADTFTERPGENERGRAAALFWPVEAVGSGTLTVDYHPAPNVSFRLEGRHDAASGDAFFGGSVPTTEAGAYVANRAAQDTVTLGVTSWVR